MTGRALNLTCAADIVAKPIRWLWPGYVPMGKITVLAGAPGLGKSLLTLMLASRVSKVASVLIVSAEDDPADTIKPRLEAAGAHHDNVHLVDAREVTDNGLVVPGIVQLPQDAYAIGAKVHEFGARLVIFDPVPAFLDGGHSAYREQEVRAALAPLKQVAEDYSCAPVLVMHLNKGDGADPLRRIANSGAFTALARSVLLFGPDPEDPEGERGTGRILTVAKGNVRAAGRGSLAMRVEATDVPGLDGKPPISTARLIEIGDSNVSAEDLLDSGEDRTAKGEAMTWLRDLLANGPMMARDVQAAADGEGISARTLKRAKQSLGVRSVKQGATGGWAWQIDSLDTHGPHGTLGPLPENKVASVGPLPKEVGNVAKEANGAKRHEDDQPALAATSPYNTIDAAA